MARVIEPIVSFLLWHSRFLASLYYPTIYHPAHCLAPVAGAQKAFSSTMQNGLLGLLYEGSCDFCQGCSQACSQIRESCNNVFGRTCSERVYSMLNLIKKKAAH